MNRFRILSDRLQQAVHNSGESDVRSVLERRLMLAQLISVKGDRAIRITKDITVVGRRPEVCDLVIPSDSISKIHSVISKTDGLLFVRDLGSTNGTRVNGQRVTRGALLPGDELAFASIKFKVHLGPAPEVEDEEVGHGDRTEVISKLPEMNTSDPDPEFDPANISYTGGDDD